MYNVKFCSFFDDNSEAQTSISCPHYAIYRHRNGSVTVTTYPDMTDIGGVERHIGLPKHHYDFHSDLASGSRNKIAEEVGHKGRHFFGICYVVNAQGRTIDKIKAKEPPKITINTVGVAAVSKLLNTKSKTTEYTTSEAESLKGIALRELKDETRWREIRDLNSEQFHSSFGPNDYYPPNSIILLPSVLPTIPQTT